MSPKKYHRISCGPFSYTLILCYLLARTASVADVRLTQALQRHTVKPSQAFRGSRSVNPGLSAVQLRETQRDSRPSGQGSSIQQSSPDTEIDEGVDDEYLLDTPGKDVEDWSAKTFELEQELQRKEEARKRMENQRKRVAKKVQEPELFHPFKPGRHQLLWKFQFCLIIVAMIGMYGLEVLIDLRSRKTINLYIKPSTCLMLGANYRGLGESIPVACARFFTCAFLHAHVFHLVFNSLTIYSVWMYFSVGAGRVTAQAWVYHWTFPIFLLSAFSGSVYSYLTILKHSGFSIGASGGCLGLATAFLWISVYFEGIPSGRLFSLVATLVSIVASCISWEAVFGGGESSTDLAAHSAGAAAGGVVAVSLSLASGRLETVTLINGADGLSCALLVALLLAYSRIAIQHVRSGRELVVRAYVHWLGMTSTGPDDKRRHTAPGDINYEVMTEEYLALLDAEEIDNNPETIIQRLKEEDKGRRKTTPDLGGFRY